jgi:hypothetical protein
MKKFLLTIAAIIAVASGVITIIGWGSVFDFFGLIERKEPPSRESAIVYYGRFPQVPDFGDMFECIIQSHSEKFRESNCDNTISYLYRYSLENGIDINSVKNRYEIALIENNFRLVHWDNDGMDLYYEKDTIGVILIFDEDMVSIAVNTLRFIE